MHGNVAFFFTSVFELMYRNPCFTFTNLQYITDDFQFQCYITFLKGFHHLQYCKLPFACTSFLMLVYKMSRT